MRSLMLICLSLCLGIAGTLLPISGLCFLLSAAALAAGGIVSGLLTRRRWLFFTLIPAGIGMLWGYGYSALVLSPAAQLVGTTQTLSAQVLNYSQASSGGHWVSVRLLTGDKKLRADLFLKNQETVLCPGDQISAELELHSSSEGGDYYGYSQGCFLTAYSRGDIEITPCQRLPLQLFPRVIAHRLGQSVSACFPEDVRGYAMALTIGDRSGLGVSDKSALKHSGIYHALALSGMHLSVLMAFLFFLKRPRHAALVGIPICIAFTLITGCSPSMVRACVMECFLLSGQALSRESDWATSLSAAGAGLMLQNPWCILNWGLQLSFLSVIGISLLCPGLYLRLQGGKSRGFRKRLRQTIALDLSVTLSAVAFTIPLMALYFGMVSLVSPLTNLLTGTMVSWCFGGSLLTALVGLVFPGIGQLLGHIFAWGFRYIALMAHGLSGLPFSCIYTDTVYGSLAVLSLYFTILLCLIGKKASKTIPICCGVTTISVCLFLLILEAAVPSFTALDVGQGQCLIFETGSGVVMVDCGGSGEDAGELAADHLAARGIRRISLLILTHYDADHSGGVPALLARIPVDLLLAPDAESADRESILQAVHNTGTSLRMIADSQTIYLGKSSFLVYGPISTKSDNDSSLSIRAQLPGLSVMVTGDMEQSAERQLLTRQDIGPTDLLVAGHHGSKYSTSQELLDALAPSAAVISVGQNSYGHPAQETLDRLADRRIKIYRTDLMGTVYLRGKA